MPDFISRYGSRSNIGKEQTAVVRLLDDDSATVRIDFKKIAMGQYVVDYCCDYLNLMENDYFGIRYMDTFKHRYWLDAAKLIVRQVKGTGSVSSPLSFSFRVKFYPADPGVLKEDITRYHLYLQVKRDLSHGRLYCPPNEAAQLAAYVLQAEVGDYNPEVHEQNYVSMYPKVLLRQSTKQEEKIAEYHKEFSGLSPVEAHSKFLQLAATFDTYGFDPYTVKDPKQPQNQAQVYLGATHRGVLVYSGNRKLYHLEWKNISLITCGGKDLIIAQNPSAVEELEMAKKKYQKLIFHCSSATFSKHLMKYINEQRVFFTFPPPRPHGTSISGKSGSSWQNSNFNKNLTLPKNFRPNKQGLDAGPISNGPPNRTRPQILETSFDTVTEPITLSSRMNSPRGPFDTSQLMDTTITTMSRDESRVMPSTSYFMDNSIIEVDEPGWSPDVSGGDNNSGVAEAIAAANKKAQLRIETILQEAKDQELYDEKMKEADDEDKKRSHMSLPVRLADKPLTVITRQPQSNGRVHVEPEPAVVLPATDQSLVGRIANAVFAAFLVSFIVISLVVLVMEVKDPSFRTMLDSVPQTYVFRSTVYEPVKSAVTSTYSRMLGRR